MDELQVIRFGVKRPSVLDGGLDWHHLEDAIEPWMTRASWQITLDKPHGLKNFRLKSGVKNFVIADRSTVYGEKDL